MSWIKNNGEQPVADDVLVKILLVNETTDIDYAVEYDWAIEGRKWDIAAYEIVKVPITTERDDFEKSALINYEYKGNFHRNKDGDYSDGYVDSAWIGWQAAIAHNQNAVDDAYERCATAIEKLRSSGENNDSWTITRDLALQRAEDEIRALIKR